MRRSDKATKIQAPDIADITRMYLTEHGYDGLWNPEIPCGCALDDLMPCAESPMDCVPGFITRYPLHDCGCGEGCDFHVGPVKGDDDDV